MKEIKVLRVWTPFNSGIAYSYLDSAVIRATELALEHNCEAIVTLDTENNGEVVKSKKVAIIRGASFNRVGSPRLKGVK